MELNFSSHRRIKITLLTTLDLNPIISCDKVHANDVVNEKLPGPT